MLDLMFILLTLIFFGVVFWYVRFCERGNMDTEGFNSLIAIVAKILLWPR